MIDYEFAGLPLHILLVHFVVIVVPLAALCLVLATAWPAARRRLGILPPVTALAALIAVPITTNAGEWLEQRVGHTALIAAHAAIGSTLLPWAAAIFLVAVVQWGWFRYFASPTAKYFERVRSSGVRVAVTTVLATAVAVTAVGAVTSVVLIGESGARAVWTNSYTQSPR